MADKRLSFPGGRWRRTAATALAFITVCAASLTLAAPASATCLRGGLGFTNINSQLINVQGSSFDYWIRILQASNKNWNDLGAGTRMGIASSSAGRVAPGEYDASWGGQYIPEGTRGYNAGFRIEINAKTIRKYYPRSVTPSADHWNRVIMAHELGHALSMDDDPGNLPSGQYSLMKYPNFVGPFYDQFRDWGYYNTPTGFDRNEVIRCNKGAYTGP